MIGRLVIDDSLPTVFRTTLLSLLFATSALAADPVPLIFDTDMGNDIDDALALAMIHSLESRGACKLLAVTVTKDHPKAAPFVDILNTRYGRPDIPIGVVKGGATKEEGKFLKLADAKAADGSPLYPHDLLDGSTAPDAIPLLRRTLEQQPDGSVVIVQVGFFTNLLRLLESAPDENSPLSGRDLVAKKVKLLSLMAGAFTPIDHNTRYREYNVVYDIPAAQEVTAEWPTPMVWSGFETGNAVTYPHQSIDLDFPAQDPIKEAYYLYETPPHDRPTWDLTAVLHAVYPDRGYFELSPPGKVVVDQDGTTDFAPQEKGRDRYLILNPTLAARAREAMVQLCTQPLAR
ncbi:nucleoside hydrolase [Luteolibacter luteus]|uniref:Nucleoside hydrolase n=1 Tax=Luteolibacter luteus TaxID=2728835 RepID=A0A858RDU4_9BACT|nr:nucleoside hydrolase [Luteolibacter luteus]QJE94791.1 nucleoside hydrolase [Luteolibacter luteus]